MADLYEVAGTCSMLELACLRRDYSGEFPTADEIKAILEPEQDLTDPEADLDDPDDDYNGGYTRAILANVANKEMVAILEPLGFDVVGKYLSNEDNASIIHVMLYIYPNWRK